MHCTTSYHNSTVMAQLVSERQPLSYQEGSKQPCIDLLPHTTTRQESGKKQACFRKQLLPPCHACYFSIIRTQIWAASQRQNGATTGKAFWKEKVLLIPQKQRSFTAFIQLHPFTHSLAAMLRKVCMSLHIYQKLHRMGHHHSPVRERSWSLRIRHDRLIANPVH